MITLTPQAFEDALEGAAERGAKKALAAVGLADDHAVTDITGLRDLFSMWRMVRNAAVKSIGMAVGAVILGALAMYFGFKVGK